MIRRLMLLLAVMLVGCILAVVVRHIIVAVVPAVGDYIGTTEAAIIGLAPFVYLIFQGFVNPVKGFLRGDTPEYKEVKRK